MSVFVSLPVTCPACGQASEVSVAQSVNADRRPDLRQAILDGTLQRAACPACGKDWRLPIGMTFQDMGAGLWILVKDPEALARWPEEEDAARALHERYYGEDAAPIQRQMGAGLTFRLVFGWPALREKILARQAGLDDAVLETLKVSLALQAGGSALGTGHELRLVEADQAHLRLRWFESASGRPISQVELPRSLYEERAGNLSEWQVLLERLRSGPYVDSWRLMSRDHPEEAPAEGSVA